jgi:quinol monooxygenase YgiN
MAIRHIVTVQVAAGQAHRFADAFRPLRAVALQEAGCEQYELFQSFDDPDRVVILERWSSQELLDLHLAAEHAGSAELVEAVIARWAPGSTPTLERFET